MNDNSSLFAITLYVPDATANALNESTGLRALIVEGVPGLDFLSFAWWEGSHTMRLGPARINGLHGAGT